MSKIYGDWRNGSIRDHRGIGSSPISPAITLKEVYMYTTKEERKEIARKAAQSRWDADIPIAEFQGDLNIGDKTISAVVLPNGKRLLTQGTFLKALGRSRSPKAGTGVLSTVDGLPFFLQAKQLKPFITNELMESTTPIFYRTSEIRRYRVVPQGFSWGTASGYLIIESKLQGTQDKEKRDGK